MTSEKPNDPQTPAPPVREADAKPPRRTLLKNISSGALGGVVIGVTVGVVLVLTLDPVELTGRLGSRAVLFLGFEAGFAGAIIGGILGGLSGLRNAP